MKRPASLMYDSRPRKSARLQDIRKHADSSARWTRYLEVLELKCDAKDLRLGRASRYCETINEFMPFARHGSLNSRPGKKAAKCSKLIADIENIMQSTVRKLSKKYMELKMESAGFVDATCELEEAYEGGDLLGMSDVAS